MNTIMAFDFGIKSIGVAISQTSVSIISPLTAIQSNCGIPDWNHIKLLLETWKVNIVIVGLPIDIQGRENLMTFKARNFAISLAERFNVSVKLQDERLSTFEALEYLSSIYKKTKLIKKKDIDSRSAMVILKDWLSTR